MTGSEKQAGFGTEFDGITVPRSTSEINYQFDGFTPGADQLKKYKDAIEFLNRNTAQEKFPAESEPAIVGTPEPKVEKTPTPEVAEAPSPAKEPTNSYLPSIEDLGKFENVSGFFGWNFNKEQLTNMAKTDDPAVKNMSNYLIENFDTVADLTSGGKVNTLGINDIRLVAKAADAARNINELRAKTVPEVLEAFDRLDANGNGFISKFEMDWSNREDPNMKVLKQNYDLLRNQTNEGKWIDRGISKADLETFQSGVAFKSMMRETHEVEDLNYRSYYSTLAGDVIGIGIVALADQKKEMSTAEQLRIIGASEYVTSAAVRWYFRDDAARHFQTTAEPAMTKLLKPLGA